MNSKFKLIGIVVIMVMGLTLVTCDFSSAVIEISGTPKVGMKLTATSINGGAGVDTTFRRTENLLWEISVPNYTGITYIDSSDISGSKNSVITIPSHVGMLPGSYYILNTVGGFVRAGRAVVNANADDPYNDRSKIVWSDWVGPIEAAD